MASGGRVARETRGCAAGDSSDYFVPNLRNMPSSGARGGVRGRVRRASDGREDAPRRVSWTCRSIGRVGTRANRARARDRLATMGTRPARERPSDGNRAATETLPRFGAQPTGNRRD